MDNINQLVAALPWGPFIERQTKYGAKLLGKIEFPSQDFWALWREHKPAMKALGVSVGKPWQSTDPNAWEALWWKPLPKEEKERREASVVASRAVNTEVVIPAPEGLTYMPFQKAGIAFAMGRDGTLIGDEMGLGKTIQALGLINSDPSIRRVLVVTKNTLKLNWAREARKWLVRPYSIAVLGPQDQQLAQSRLRLFTFDDKEWQHAAKESGDTSLLGNAPVTKVAVGPDALGVKVGPTGKAKPGVSAVTGKPVDQAGVGLIHGHDPLGACLGDGTLPVEHPGHVGSLGGGGRRVEGCGDASAIGEGQPAHLPLVPKGHVGHAEAGGKSLRLEAGKEGGVRGGDRFVRSVGGELFHGCLCVVNFDVLHNYEKVFHAAEWDLVVVDEAQYLKNRESRRTKALFGFKPKRTEDQGLAKAPVRAKRRLVLTGTPVENEAGELWTLVNFCDPARFPNYSSFKWRFQTGPDAPMRLPELNRLLRESVMVRRLKKDVLKELPAKTRTISTMSAEGAEDILLAERRIQDWMECDVELEEARAEYELAKAGDSDEEFAAAAKRLKDMSNARIGEVGRVRHATALAKVTRLKGLEMLRDDMAESRKVIIFAHHLDVLAAIKAEFPSGVLVTGDTPLAERDHSVTRFQTDPHCGPFIGSIRATGEGLTLTAATTVIFIEMDWVPGKMSQCEDRAHRIGQKDNVLVKHYVVDGSLDCRMVQTLLDKQAIADAALDAETKAAVEAPLPVTEANPKTRSLGTRDELAAAAEKMTPERNAAIHLGLQRLASVCDGAKDKDECGFNGLDSRIGKSLAAAERLTPKQAALGWKIIAKYKRQLGGLWEECRPVRGAAKEETQNETE